MARTVLGMGLAAILALAVLLFVRSTPQPDVETGVAMIDTPGVANPLPGSWAAMEYRLASGDVHPLEGRIFFTESEWTVLFFVLDDAGTPVRASAEGGGYSLRGEMLTFRHARHFSRGSAVAGLSESPMRMEIVASGSEAEEPTGFRVDGDTLTLSFPSGNTMRFVRSSS